MKHTDQVISLRDVEAAAERIAGRVRRTPIIAIEGTSLWAKCESLQESGSFKLRGATNAVLALEPAGVVTGSSGNHGRALALAAARAGIPATVVMTPDSSPFKRAQIEALGARVVDCEPGTEARERASLALAEAEGLTLVPPYDHPLVMAGQGTVGLEVVEDAPDLQAVVVPLGGGGLISGISTAVKARLPHVQVVGVEPAQGDDFARSLASGRRQSIPVPRTICDGARVQTPGRLTFEVVRARVDQVTSATDEEVVEALRMLLAAGIYAEPTAALGVAGALQMGLGEGTVCVVTGRNISFQDLAGLID